MSANDIADFEDDLRISTISFYVKSTECSKYSDLSLPVLLGNFQEAGDKGAFDTGFDRSLINSHNACWIILRMRVHLNKLPKWRDTYHVNTWSTGQEKFYFDREYEIYSDDNELMGYASSLWILADLNTHRPLIPSKIPGLSEAYPKFDKLVFGERCSRVAPVKRDYWGDDSPSIVKYGDFSELDHNHHVNNTRYMAWTLDCLYKSGFDCKNILDFSISYVSEVLEGEKVELFIKEVSDKNCILVSGYKNNDTNVFDAEVYMN